MIFLLPLLSHDKCRDTLILHVFYSLAERLFNYVE